MLGRIIMKRLLSSLIAFFGLTLAANAQCAAGYTQLSNVFACQANSGAPVITSPSTASGTVGTAFSYQITATNSPTSFGASGLPSPLSVNTSTGLISGTPTATSTNTVGLSATNGSGTGNQNLALTIGGGGGGITATHLTSGDNSTGGSSATTASISPAANTLVIVSVSGGLNGGTIPTVTGAGGTWTRIAYTDDNGGSGGNHGVALLRDLSASPGSGALTIGFAGVSENHIEWSVDQFSGVNTSGTHGSGAIVQSVTATSSGTNTGQTLNLAALGSPNNAAMGWLRKTGANIIVAGTGFTELSNTHVSAEVEAEWAINKTAVAWTWASESTITTQIAIEIKAGM
jgi:Putative Ig domain